MALRFASCIFTATLLAVTLAPRPADACQYPNCHSDGAVPKPAGLDLSLPFQQGENVKILSGYGPNAGSSLHCRAQDGQCANDYYALDLILPDHPNSGKGQPVLAAAAGTVIAAGWGTSGWASYGQRVYLQHDVDGHKYVTMYAHLDSVAVAKGQKLAKGELLGTLGQSCNEQLACANFSTPHVHFALHRDSGFGGSGSGGSYGGRAVIPEPIDGYSDLSQGDIVVSKNGAEEPPPPPPPPPDECPPIPPTGAILEDDGPCAASIGDALNAAGGHGGHAFWTPLAVPSPDYAAGLLFTFEFEQAGSYTLSAYIPAAVDDRAPAATYKIAHANGADKAILDQTQGGDVWLTLGTYDFAPGQGLHWIRIGDNYDLPEHQGKKLALDAIKFAPAMTCECNEVGALDTLPCLEGGGEQSRTCDGCSWGPWSACSDASTGGVSTTGGDDTSVGGTGGGTGGAPTSGPAGTGGPGTTDAGTSSPGITTAPASSGPNWGGSDTDSGCACAADMSDRTGPFGLLLIGLLVRRRRPLR